MALTHCPYCGHVVSTTAERCPSCGAPVTREVSEPVETPPAFAENKPQPVNNNEPDYGMEDSHAGRNIMLVVVALLLAGAGVFWYFQQSKPNEPQSVWETMDNDTIAVDDTIMCDNASMDYAIAEDTCVAEPEEILEISGQVGNGSKQLLATYRYGDLQRKYYWNRDNSQLSIYDENGTCLKKHNLGDIFISSIEAENGIVAKLYNHHVYFVGYNGVGGTTGFNVIFYLTPQEGNGIHVIEDLAEGEKGYKFQKSSVRVRRYDVKSGENGNGYDVDEHWETIPLK